MNDHLVNLNLNPGRAHDEYTANQTRECLSEARNVGRAVKVIIKAKGNGEEYENPGLIFAWLLGDKGVNRMHASRYVVRLTSPRHPCPSPTLVSLTVA